MGYLYILHLHPEQLKSYTYYKIKFSNFYKEVNYHMKNFCHKVFCLKKKHFKENRVIRKQ